MAVAGALIGKAIGAFGTKPKIPSFAEISPESVQAKTVAGNIANFEQAAKLATQVNAFNQDELTALMEKALPGGKEKITKNISSLLSGEIPDDVAQGVWRSSAAKALQGGFSGSGFGRNLTARDLGLTSLDLTQRGLDSASRWLAQTTAAAPLMDATSMFFSPQQRLGFEQQQQAFKYERDLTAAQVKAMPDPATAALGKEIDRFFNTWAQYGMGMLGGAMGGAGGMGGPTGGGGFGGGSNYLGRSGMSGMGWLESQVNAGSAGGQGI